MTTSHETNTMRFQNSYLRKPRNPNRSRAFAARFAHSPAVGTIIACDLSFIRQDDTQEGTSTTPMTKIRLSHDGTWQQVRPQEAGLYVFFITEPDVLHTKFEIVSVIPSNTGCYAKLL